MIRHTVELKKNPQLHNAEIIFYLPGIQDGDIVKLTQHHHLIYATYRISEKIGQKYAQVSQQFLNINNFHEGKCVLQVQNCAKVNHLVVNVSQLDWKIVNLKQMKISMQFLQQVQAVWPGALLPIFYDDCNFVVLKPECVQPGRLDVNTTVQFRQILEKQQQQEQQLESIEFEQRLINAGQCEVVEGYVNVIKIPHKSLKRLSGDLNQTIWIVENNIEYFDYSSIEQFSKLTKQEAANDKQKLNKKLVILSALKQQDEQANNCFKCSALCKQLLGLSDSILLSNQSIYKPKVQTLSYSLFIKQTNYFITIEQISTQRCGTEKISIAQKQKIVKGLLAEKIVNAFTKNKPFLILQQLYPFSLNNQLFSIKLTHKTNKNVTNNFYELKYVGNLDETRANQITNQLIRTKVNFVSNQISKKSANLQKMYEAITQWQTVNNVFDKNSALNTQKLLKQQVNTLFSTIYQEQLIKIIDFIQQKQISKPICLVTSFGNNGKSFLHQYLQSRDIPMWKINFRELTNPQLNFATISSYIQWIISNSPYNVIFFDDVDALCGRVEDSDQHKKKQKTISKLISRKISHFLNIYNKKIISTAKSQSSVQQQFPMSQLTVNLRNPTLQLREKSLRALHVIAKADNSPIRDVRPGLQVESVKQQDLIKIAESTQSLTFATFAKHAIQLTLPQTKKSSQLFDFNKLAGLEQAKKSIKSLIQKPIKYGALFKSVPIKLPRGVLLYGSTGNGKTALGSSLKDEFKMKYFSVKGSDILSKYIGGSEAAVRDIFEKALSVSPSIIFFDQFQSIVPKRSANNTGVNDRIVNQFLCYLDGVSSTAGVYIVAASSRPDLIDPAVLRPGRLDAHLFLDYPTPQQRRQLFEMFQNSVQIDVPIEKLVQLTENFSYSDLIGLLKELRIKKSAQVLKQQKYQTHEFKRINEQLFKTTLQNFKLSVAPHQQKNQLKIYQAFKKGSAPDIKHQKQIQQ